MDKTVTPAEAVSRMIVRRVKVDRGRTPEQVLNATGRPQHTDREVLDAMPRGEGEEVDVYLFKLGRKVNDAELQEEYELRGLVPDPYALAAVNGADPAFADEHPNGTHWKDANGNWCYIAFGLWFHGYFVDVRHRVLSWNDSWFFGGVRNLNASKL